MKSANVLDNSEDGPAGQPAGEGAATRLVKPEKLTVNATREVAFNAHASLGMNYAVAKGQIESDRSS